jgi:hypothetical protein
MKNTILLVSLLILVTGPLNGMELKDLERKEAEISIVGDDSFVTKRKYGYTSQDNVEVLEFRGGWLSWSELNSGIYYTSGTNPSSFVVRRFNSSKFFAKFVSGSAKRSDVKFKNDSRLGYYWISQEGERLSCLWSTGEWGIGAVGVSGNNRITVSMCKPGKKKLVEDFLHDLMARVQIDGGTINKMKAAGNYNAPKKQAIVKKEVSKEQPSPTQTKPSSNQTIKSRLAKLKKLLDTGLITKEEAAEKRKAILDSL